MKKNMGNADRSIRLFAAAGLVALNYFNVIEGTLGTVAYAAAAIFAVTSFINFCPLYTLLGVNTCKIK